MKTIRYSLFLLTAAFFLSACEYNNFPSGPEEYVYDTIDCSGMNIPAGSILVRTALNIGKQLKSGSTSKETYYIKGIVTGFNTSEKYNHVEEMNGYGKAYVYIQDNVTTNTSFYGYRVAGMNGAKFTSLDQLAIGDFIVIKSTIQNYNGTIETAGSPCIVFSTNPLANQK